MSRVPFRTFDAVVFDLDGVLTDTAEVHLRAWSELFNAFLEERAVQEIGDSGAFREFGRADYLEFVDGKPRYEGVASFLASREIALPRGEPTDAPGSHTICALGNQKNRRFNELLQRDGVAVLPGVVRLLRELRQLGVAAIFDQGVARVRCPDCRHEFLVAFSCKLRGLCPSCHQKRELLWAEWAERELLEDVPHRQVVFTIPKRLRVFFRYDRKLLGQLAGCAWRALKLYFDCYFEGTDVTPGAVGLGRGSLGCARIPRPGR
ncbi:MAG: transposase zinc-binding domain-containing protein, partial [Thermoanaerobaculia bacterium]